MTKVDCLPDEPPHVPRYPGNCYLVTCKDDPDLSSTLRVTHLEGHLDHVERNWKRYLAAGPIRNPNGERFVGSVFLLFADSYDEAKELMQGDPYFTCGMYASIEYHELSLSIGQFIGGKIWDDPQLIRDRATGGPITA